MLLVCCPAPECASYHGCTQKRSQAAVHQLMLSVLVPHFSSAGRYLWPQDGAIAGRVAFNKEMGALDSVEHGSGVDAADVLLRTTKETTLRVFAPYRVFKPWNASVRAGKAAMKQFGVRQVARVSGDGSCLHDGVELLWSAVCSPRFQAQYEQCMEEAPLERCLMHEGLSMYSRLSHQQHVALEVRQIVTSPVGPQCSAAAGSEHLACMHTHEATLSLQRFKPKHDGTCVCCGCRQLCGTW